MKEEALKLADIAESMAIEIPADWSSGEPKNVMTDIACMIRKLVEELECWQLTAQHHEFMSRHLGQIVKKQEQDKALDNLMAWQQEFDKPVVWMYQDKSTHEVSFQKNMRAFVDHSKTYETPLYTAPRELSDGCGNCHACLVGVMENNIPVTSQRMIVCSDCGNKRCPKASNHRHKCTGSNEVGQYGSIYTAPRELSDEEILQIAFERKARIPNNIGNDMLLISFAKAILKKASEK